MTTKITVQTGDCPAAVHTTSCISSAFPTSRYFSHAESTTFVPPETNAEFSISSDAGFSVRELPKGATSLDDDPSAILASSSASSIAQAQPAEAPVAPEPEADAGAIAEPVDEPVLEPVPDEPVPVPANAPAPLDVL